MGYPTSTFQPIREAYQGYMMRSRLEVRWARWLDECLVKWSYESQGFRKIASPTYQTFASRLNCGWRSSPSLRCQQRSRRRRWSQPARAPVLIVVAEPWASFGSVVVLRMAPRPSATPWVEVPTARPSVFGATACSILDNDDDPYAYRCGCARYRVTTGGGSCQPQQLRKRCGSEETSAQ